MIIHSIKRLLKTKYNGSKIMLSKFDDDNIIDIVIQIPQEYVNETDKLKQEIFDLTKSEFIKIIPIVEV